MPRKKKSLGGTVQEHVPTNRHWIVNDTLRVNGRVVEPGTEVKISGEPGRFTFRRHVLNPANGAEWIDVFGGTAKAEQSRSFRPSRIATVHRLTKRRVK